MLRLLNAHSYTFEWVSDPGSVQYVILSHVWAPEGEQSFSEVSAILDDPDTHLGEDGAPSRLSEKVARFCARARADGFSYIWIDTCCIDKASSAELSEAINSMFQWYSAAARCYVHLHDVADDDRPQADKSQFRRSKWFTRGWTLQELLAPHTVIFLSKEWREIGTRQDLAKTIEEVTGITADVLEGFTPISSVCVARRMSWAAERKTTREEDEAYSLMGLFGVHMPTIYGEGRKAFVRLQEEIMRQIPDDTLFAWGDRLPLRSAVTIGSLSKSDRPGGLLASSPQAFKYAKDLRAISHVKFMSDLYFLTERGTRARSAVESLSEYTVNRYGVRAVVHAILDKHLVFLPCVDADDNLVALLVDRIPDTPIPDLFQVGARDSSGRFYRLASLQYAVSMPLSANHISLYVDPAPAPAFSAMMIMKEPWKDYTIGRMRPRCVTIIMLKGGTEVDVGETRRPSTISGHLIPGHTSGPGPEPSKVASI